MTNKEPLDNIGYVASVKLLDVEKRYKPAPKHYVYIIQVTWSNPENLFIIYRRYTQFFDLQCKLLDLFAEIPLQSNGNNQSREIPFLPGKIILGRSQIRQIALERKQTLDEYCQTLISLPQHISRSRPILEFFHPLSTDVQQPIKFITNEKKPVMQVISEPSKLANYRCLADFTATDEVEMSLKRNDIVQLLQKHANGWWFVQNGDQTGFAPGAYLQPSELKKGAREGKTLNKQLHETYIVNNRYEAKGQDELTLDQGSFVTVIEKSFTGWWTVKFNTITGHFPAIYLSSCEGRHTPGNVISDASIVTSKTQQSDDSDWDDDDDDEEYPTESSNDAKPELYYAHSDFTDNVGDCLSFQRGDLIEIHDKHSSGWWSGRQMNTGHVLTWIPANFLQKEPILDESVDNTNNHSSDCANYENLPDITLGPLINEQEQQQQEKSKVSTESTYENLESQSLIDVTYSTVDHKKSSISTSSTSTSVKDLVKKFNGK